MHPWLPWLGERKIQLKRGFCFITLTSDIRFFWACVHWVETRSEQKLWCARVLEVLWCVLRQTRQDIERSAVSQTFHYFSLKCQLWQKRGKNDTLLSMHNAHGIYSIISLKRNFYYSWLFKIYMRKDFRFLLLTGLRDEGRRKERMTRL